MMGGEGLMGVGAGGGGGLGSKSFSHLMGLPFDLRDFFHY